MAKHILKCTGCGHYSLKSICPSCQSQTIPPKPAKYSPEDPYGHYRRQVKRSELIARGLL